MPTRVWLAAVSILLCACTPPEGSHSTAIVGAVLIDGAGGPPRSDSVVVVADDRIRGAGPRTGVPIPSQANKFDGSGKFLIPALVDICDTATPPGLLQPANPDQARAQVADAAAKKVASIHLAQADRATVEAALEAARAAGIPVTGHISTLAGARLLVEHGASSLIGMIADTEDLDSSLLSRLRDLRIVVAPALSRAGSGLEVARRNTLRMFQAGVPLAIASQGGDPIHEAGLLVEAGVSPLDAIVAATRNGAMALRQLDQRGTVEAGKRADLVLLTANPGEDIRNLSRVFRKMSGGEWHR